MSLWNTHSFLSQALDEPAPMVAATAAPSGELQQTVLHHHQHHPQQQQQQQQYHYHQQPASIHLVQQTALTLEQQPQPQPQPLQQQLLNPGQQDSQACYQSLLGMAESFRQCGNVRMTLHCLKAVLQFHLPESIIVRTHLQIGKLLMQHASKSCVDRLPAVHLEAAWSLRAGCTASQEDTVACLEAADLLVDCLCGGGGGGGGGADVGMRVAALLEEALLASQGMPEWHCRFLLKLAQHLSRSDPGRACELLALGSQYAQQRHSEYTRGLFLLAKCILLLSNRQLAEVHNTLTVASKVIDAMRPGCRKQETLKIFSLIIQVLNHLIAGQAKQAHPILRQLQKAIQAFSVMQEPQADDPTHGGMDQFEWLSREHMSVLVYLLTLLHNMEEASYDKVQRYTDKALTQVEKLKAVEDNSPLLTVLHQCILEQSFQCRLVSGDRTGALQDAAASVKMCSASHWLGQRRAAQCHTMLALYAMTTNCLGAAESQFRCALRLNPRPDLHQFVCLNLGLVMLRQNRLSDCQRVLAECQQVLGAVGGGGGGGGSGGGHCVRAASHWVHGLLALMLGDFNQAKLCIKESLKLANAENLRRLLTLSLIVLGQVHYASGQYEEVKKVVDAAVQLADQIPDEAVQLWASTLMRDLHRAEGNPELEAACAQRHSSLLVRYQASIDKATVSPDHQLIYWLEGSQPELPPSIQTASSVATTATAPTPPPPPPASAAPAAVPAATVSQQQHQQQHFSQHMQHQHVQQQHHQLMLHRGQ